MLHIVFGRAPITCAALDIVSPSQYEEQDTFLKDTALSHYRRWVHDKQEGSQPWLYRTLAGYMSADSGMQHVLQDQSDHVWELLEGMLMYDPANRFTVHDCLGSAFFVGMETGAGRSRRAQRVGGRRRSVGR